MSETPLKIVLTDDPVLRAKLTRKLGEYEERYGTALELHRASMRQRASGEVPTTATFRMARLPYKYLVLMELLEQGVVHADPLCDRLLDELGEYDDYRYEQALKIVDAYNRGAPEELHGSTGLR